MPLPVLLVEPDVCLRAAIVELLRGCGRSVVAVPDIEDGAATEECVAMILDAEGRADGFEVFIRSRRQKGFTGPVLMLGGQSELAAEIVPKPLRLGVLADRLDDHLRIAARTENVVTVLGVWRLESGKRLLRHENGAEIMLTDKEAAIMAALAALCPERMGREQLLASVWGYNDRVDTHTVETHIYRLRRKLEDHGASSLMLVSAEGGYGLCLVERETGEVGVSS